MWATTAAMVYSNTCRNMSCTSWLACQQVLVSPNSQLAMLHCAGFCVPQMLLEMLNNRPGVKRWLIKALGAVDLPSNAPPVKQLHLNPVTAEIKMSDYLGAAFNDPSQYTNGVIVVDGQEIHVHKMILAKARRVFADHWTQTDQPLWSTLPVQLLASGFHMFQRWCSSHSCTLVQSDGQLAEQMLPQQWRSLSWPRHMVLPFCCVTWRWLYSLLLNLAPAVSCCPWLISMMLLSCVLIACISSGLGAATLCTQHPTSS